MTADYRIMGKTRVSPAECIIAAWEALAHAA
jgi:hypothetical protein